MLFITMLTWRESDLAEMKMDGTSIKIYFTLTLPEQKNKK
jgi:hypothetical protein